MYLPTLVWSTHDTTQRASTRPTIVQDVVGPGFRNVGCLTDWLKIGENVWQICDKHVTNMWMWSVKIRPILQRQSLTIIGAAMVVNRCQQIWWLQWTYLSLLIFCHKLATSANSWTFSMVGVSSGKIVSWVGIICEKINRPSPWSGHLQALCMPHSDLRHTVLPKEDERFIKVPTASNVHVSSDTRWRLLKCLRTWSYWHAVRCPKTWTALESHPHASR